MKTMSDLALIEISSSDLEPRSINISKGELVYMEHSPQSLKYITAFLGLAADQDISIKIDGKDLSQFSIAEHQANRKRIAYVSQAMQLISDATVQENITFYLASIKTNASSEVSWLLKEFDIETSSKVEQLTEMEQYKLRLIIGLAKKPDLLILDNPYAQVDSKMYETIMIRIYQLLMDNGITCIAILSNPKLKSSFPGRQLDLS